MTTTIAPTEAASAEHADPELKLDLSKYIETRFFEERPHIRNRRIPVASIAYAEQDGEKILQLVQSFGISEAEALAALLYYAEYQDVIDTQQEAERDALAAEYEQHHGG